MKKEKITEKQKKYYAETASEYDNSHILETEHELALSQLIGYLSYYNVNSLLDVGAGTGRVLRHAGEKLPDLKIMGVEPVDELREVAYKNGVTTDSLVAGDACKLNFEDDSWDIVCAFGILHHIPDVEKAVAEMCRVARHGIFFSDLNNFGCGSITQRMISQTLHSLKLWKPFQWVINGGRHDKFSEGDGVYYSYSLFDSLKTIRKKFPQIHLSNTKGTGKNLYRECSHLSVFAVKSDDDLAELNPKNLNALRK